MTQPMIDTTAAAVQASIWGVRLHSLFERNPEIIHQAEPADFARLLMLKFTQDVEGGASLDQRLAGAELLSEEMETLMEWYNDAHRSSARPIIDTVQIQEIEKLKNMNLADLLSEKIDEHIQAVTKISVLLENEVLAGDIGHASLDSLRGQFDKEREEGFVNSDDMGLYFAKVSAQRKSALTARFHSDMERAQREVRENLKL